MTAYYNENDEFAAAWLRALIEKGLIARGDVDNRSIRDVRPDDLRGYSQCHFFAGIGGWSLAFRMAGLSDDFPAWSGSCPCQPFSSAGNRKGKADDRHLWPAWFPLIRGRRPAIVFGEQVASAIGHGWLDSVASDLESEGYEVGAAVLPASSVGAFHKRDRLWFVANSGFISQRKQEYPFGPVTRQDAGQDVGGRCERHGGDVADTCGLRSFSRTHPRVRRGEESPRARHVEFERRCGTLGNAAGAGCQGQRRVESTPGEGHFGQPRPSNKNGFWNAAAPLECGDGKTRFVEPGIPLLAHGVRNRVGKLRGYGNAIVPQVAAQFIAAAIECAP